MNTEAKPQKTTEMSTAAMPSSSLWLPAPWVMTAVPARARARQMSLTGVMVSFSSRAARMVTDTGVRALMRESMADPVRAMPIWIRKMVRK